MSTFNLNGIKNIGDFEYMTTARNCLRGLVDSIDSRREASEVQNLSSMLYKEFQRDILI